MIQRTVGANLPLHYDKVLLWLSERMAKLGVIMAQAILFIIMEKMNFCDV